MVPQQRRANPPMTIGLMPILLAQRADHLAQPVIAGDRTGTLRRLFAVWLSRLNPSPDRRYGNLKSLGQATHAD